MAKANKFGTFGGVFSPSILTILGVIMYLRFPQIIGQAGLINTIGIIVIAHIISITTSLSVASLSTDKPVQNGGTYFMISRSLGLPIGGTLGLALFVGLSFSVSLYLIGFAESFLQYWGMDASKNTIRLTGSIVLFAVTTITFISTSLAIKSQYVIMAAIVLSLFSIFLGNHEFHPETINFAPLATSAPFMVLFGIFFPAVTGFEAGVSMSGDLKDPKKSLPVGAMMAVGVGFVVYIGLALFYAFTVDANALVNDPQILFKISLVPALVIAGIWGATLSSALGSILGAPRILQAIAMDKIAPKCFAKGTGSTKEPRNALLLAFVIAEAGILIGELDVIARIVSMFFITTYAFLNLASAIESWSSSDFRPAFRIPRFVSILGALSAFIVMVLLDFLALAGATIALGLLYFYLQRKELILESGDAWNSFWTNLAKKALLKLSIKKDNARNWRPNIVLFSGGEKARPHLVELGLSLTGKLGALTDFELTADDKIQDTRKQTNPQDTDSTGYFVRQLGCNSIQQGIKTVTSIYGFSGFEPNTVLLGWSKNAESKEFLSEIIRTNKAKKLNTVFLSYDKTAGFGKKQSIDIWWTGKGALLNFSLNILRFLLSDAAWRDAQVRIMIINNDSSLEDSIIRNTNAILIDKRIKAEVKIISDDFGSRKTAEIIQTESAGTDLLLLGLSQKNAHSNPKYIEKINSFCSLPSSVLLLSPSDEFEDINLIDGAKLQMPTATATVELELNELPEMDIKLVKNKIENLDNDLMFIGEDFYEKTVKTASIQLQVLVTTVQEASANIIQNLQKDLEYAEKYEHQKIVDKGHSSFLRNILNIVEDDNLKALQETEHILQKGIAGLNARLGNYIYEAAESIAIPYRLAKGKEKTIDFPFSTSIAFYIQAIAKHRITEQFTLFEENSKAVLLAVRKLVFMLNDKLDSENAFTTKEFDDELTAILNEFDVLKTQIETADNNFMTTAKYAFRAISIKLAGNLKTAETLKKSRKLIKSKTKNFDESLTIFAETWGTGMQMLNNSLYLDVLVLSKKLMFTNIVLKGNERIASIISDSLFSKQNKLIENLYAASTNSQAEIESVVFPDKINLTVPLNECFDRAAKSFEALPEVLNLPETIYKESSCIAFSDYNSVTVNLSKAAYFNIDVQFHEPLYREIENLEAIVRRAVIESKEANSMLLFHQNNTESTSSEEHSRDKDTSLFKKFQAQIEGEKTKVEMALSRMNHYTEKYISEAFSKLFYHSIMEAGKNRQTTERENRHYTLFISKFYKQIKELYTSSLIYILNNTSNSIVLSKQYLEEKQSKGVQTKEILDLVNELLPDRKTYSSVPVFYRNLLSSSSKITDEFWIPRQKEMAIIKEAHNRHNRGFGGAVMVTGVHGAGKTTFSRYAVNHLFNPKNIMWVNAPVAGSTNPEDLFGELKKQLGRFDDFSKMFSSMPHESVIVINDLELWWERRPGGGDVILQIIELIKLYSQKVFFILNCNTFAYNIFKQLYAIHEYSIGEIACRAFNSLELQQMILQRHKSSGINFTYNGKPEESISQLTYSVLFNKYFKLSEGIPGTAINAWKANIRYIDNDNIDIRKPKKINSGILNELSNEWLIALSILIMHKVIDTDKLVRITNTSKEHATNLLFAIANSGLIVKKNNRTYTLGRNVEPLITEVCIKKGLI